MRFLDEPNHAPERLNPEGGRAELGCSGCCAKLAGIRNGMSARNFRPRTASFISVSLGLHDECNAQQSKESKYAVTQG
jgi:hypothetical protein